MRTSLSLHCYPANGSMILPKQEKFAKALSRYAEFHQNSSLDKNARTLTWMCTPHHWCGGLGDRVKGITYTLLLALLSQRRLLITWEYFGYTFLRPNSILLSSHLSGQPLTLFSVPSKSGIDQSASDATKILRSIGGGKQNVFLATNLEPHKLLTEKWVSDAKWVHDGLKEAGLGDLSPEDVDKLQGLVFHYLFTLSHNLLDKVQHARSVLGLEGTRYVAVHVRTGFYGTKHEESEQHSKLIRLHDKWEKILQCAVRTADTFLGRESPIFLACDSNAVKEIARRRYGHRVRTLNTTLMHSDKLPEGRRPEDERAGILSMWIDLILLAESYALVHAKSGFAILAGQLCSLSDDRTVDGLHCSY